MKHSDRIHWHQQQHSMTWVQSPWEHNWNINRLPENPSSSLLHNSITRWWLMKDVGARPFKRHFLFPPQGGVKCEYTWEAFAGAGGNCRSMTRSNCLRSCGFKSVVLALSQRAATPLTSSAQITGRSICWRQETQNPRKQRFCLNCSIWAEICCWVSCQQAHLLV